MKFLVWLICAVDVYLGLRCFLNAIHVLHTSKYSQTTTVIFAVLFLGDKRQLYLEAWCKEYRYPISVVSDAHMYVENSNQ